MGKILKGLLWGVAICAVITHFTENCSTTQPLQKTYSDTTFVTIFDTVEVERVVARDSVVVRHEVAKLAVVGEDRNYKNDRSDRKDRKDSISFSRAHENGKGFTNFGNGFGNTGNDFGNYFTNFGKEVDFPTKDSVEVVIPITQTHYQDSLYDMWVSGYRVNVDSVRLYVPKTCSIINTHTTEMRYEKRKPWSVTVGVGYGIAGNNIQPFVGITLGYTIMRW